MGAESRRHHKFEGALSSAFSWYPGIKTRPRIVAFEMIGTVFSLDALSARFEVAGLLGATLEVWFARILRDAFARVRL